MKNASIKEEISSQRKFLDRIKLIVKVQLVIIMIVFESFFMSNQTFFNPSSFNLYRLRLVSLSKNKINHFFVAVKITRYIVVVFFCFVCALFSEIKVEESNIKIKIEFIEIVLFDKKILQTRTGEGKGVRVFVIRRRQWVETHLNLRAFDTPPLSNFFLMTTTTTTTTTFNTFITEKYVINRASYKPLDFIGKWDHLFVLWCA